MTKLDEDVLNGKLSYGEAFVSIFLKFFGYTLEDPKRLDEILSENQIVDVYCPKHDAVSSLTAAECRDMDPLQCCYSDYYTRWVPPLKRLLLLKETVKAKNIEHNLDMKATLESGWKNNRDLALIKCAKHNSEQWKSGANYKAKKGFGLECCGTEAKLAHNSLPLEQRNQLRTQRLSDSPPTEAELNTAALKNLRKRWSKKVRAAGNYTCCLTGVKSSSATIVTAHHLYDFGTHEKLRESLNNGIPIHLRYHELFHNVMGDNCTVETFIDFLYLLLDPAHPKNSTLQEKMEGKEFPPLNFSYAELLELLKAQDILLKEELNTP